MFNTTPAVQAKLWVLYKLDSASIFFIPPGDKVDEELGLAPLTVHRSRSPEVIVSLADWGHEDVLMIRVSHRGFQGQTVNAVITHILVLILPI